MASVTELSLTPAPTSGCGCGHAHETDWPRLDARQVPHAIRHGVPPQVSVPDAAAVLTTIHALYRSATLRRPVDLAELAQDPAPLAYRVGP